MDLGVVSLGDVITDPVTGERLSSAEKHLLTVDLAVACEEAGLHRVHVGEHHGMEYVFSSPPVLLTAIAARTSTIRLGSGVTLLANLDPVRVAEDYATVDILSGGRVELIGGRGNIFPSMYELLGVPLDESADRFEENLRLLIEIWTSESVTWKGRFRTPLSDVRIEPPPVQQPHPPVWVGGGFSRRSSELCASLGLPLMLPVTTFQPAATFAPAAAHYRDLCATPRVGAVVHAFVGTSSQDAAARFAPRYEAYHDWARDIMTSTGMPVPPFMQHFDYDAIVGPDGSALAGSPAEVVDGIGRLRELLGVDTLLLCLDLGGIPRAELLDMTELIGAEVLPQLRT